MSTEYDQPDPPPVDFVALIEQDRRDERTSALVQMEADQAYAKLMGRQAALERRRLEHVAALESGELSEASEKFYAQLLEDVCEDLDDIDDPIPVIDGLLYQETVNYLGGASGAYKSVVALDMAARVGAGLPFADMETTQCGALYIVAEGASGMKFRKKAWQELNERPMQNVKFLPYSVQIANEVQMPALIKYAVENDIRFIVFDTQAMCTLGTDENSNPEMAIIIDAVLVLAQRTNGCVLLVAHTGKDEANGLRGASGQYANVNTVIVAKRNGSDPCVNLSTARSKGGKQKDAAEIEDLDFDIEMIAGSMALKPKQYQHDNTPLPFISGREGIVLRYVVGVAADGGATASAIAQEITEQEGLARALKANSIQRLLARLLQEDLIRKAGTRYVATRKGHEVIRD